MKLEENWYENLLYFNEQKNIQSGYQLILLENEDYTDALLLTSKYGKSREKDALKLIEREKERNCNNFTEYSTMNFILYLIETLSKRKRHKTQRAIKDEAFEYYGDFLNLFPFQAILEKITQNNNPNFNKVLLKEWDLENELNTFFKKGDKSKGFEFGKKCLHMTSYGWWGGWNNPRNPDVPFYWY